MSGAFVLKRRLCGLLIFGMVMLTACSRAERHDEVVASIGNPSGTYVASVVKRKFTDRGLVAASDVTFVLVDKSSSGSPHYENGQDFDAKFVAMSPSQCGPLQLTWVTDSLLRIKCADCGLALNALGRHANRIGTVQIVYDGFPDRSFWETSAKPN
jgi:hypothetical protein